MKTILSQPVKFLLSIILTAHILTAQPVINTPPIILSQKSLGGSGDDAANSIYPTSDGGFIMAGSSTSNDFDVSGNHGQDDFCLLKLDATGNRVWGHLYGGTGNDEAYVAVPTLDGGYAIAGKSSSKNGDITGNHGGSDFWLIKTNDQGTLEWQKSYGGSLSDKANAMRLTPDGGFILAGVSYSNDGDVSGNHGLGDAWVIKIDPNGNLQWQKAIGGSQYDIARDIQLTDDGGYLVTGFLLSGDGDVTNNNGQEDFWFFKMDANGAIQWIRTMGGTGGDCGSAGLQTIDEGYVFCGLTHSNDMDVVGPHGDHDVWIVKTDPYGIAQWTRCLGGSAGDNGIDIKQQSDGTIITSAYSCSNDGDVSGLHGSQDIWLTALDTSGNLLWQKTFGGSNGDYPRNLQILSTGQYLLAGITGSHDGDVSENLGSNDFWFVKLGAACSDVSATITYTTLNLCGLSNIILTANSGTGLTYQWQRGEKNISGATNEIYSATAKGTYKVIVTNADGCSKTSVGVKVSKSCKESLPGSDISAPLLSIYPNPGKCQFMIDLTLSFDEDQPATIELMSGLGQIVFSEKTLLLNGILKKEIIIDHDVAEGIYLVKVIVRDQIFSGSIIYRK